MTRAILYARFSPRPDADTTESVVNQLKELRARAEREGWTVAESDCFCDEDASGSDWERPGLWSAVRAVKPGDVFLAYSQDRIARDTTIQSFVLHQILSRGGEIHTIENGSVRGDDPVSKFIATMFGAFAELQRSLINLRSRKAHKRKLREGRFRGKREGLPYGHRWVDFAEGKVEEDPDEQANIQLIFELHRAGMNRGQIADELNAMGKPGRGGKPWERWHVRNILSPGRHKKRRVDVPKL
jgi:site-specific DNA recombinase